MTTVRERGWGEIKEDSWDGSWVSTNRIILHASGISQVQGLTIVILKGYVTVVMHAMVRCDRALVSTVTRYLYGG